jgi:endonuclease YncB( thermonuclease family)
MRETIRAELDRINPTDDARRALELIIESSVRPSELDGELKLTIIDQDGKPRMIERDGQQTDFTLHDLLEELRIRYPVLFSPARTDLPPPERDEDQPRKPEKPQRDWINLDSPEATNGPDALRPAPIPASLDEPVSGTMHLREWSRRAFGSWKTSASPHPATRVLPADDSTSMTAEHERNVFSGMPMRSWRRPGVALGAVSVLALLGVGAFLFQGEEPAAPQAGSSAPAVASNATPSPLQDPEPSTTGSTASSASLRGVPDVIDTATLSLNGEVVRLFGVEWAPGGGKPEDLTGYLKGREVACEPAGGNDVYRCQVGNQDLSRVVLFNGGGRPTDDATPELKAAADKAREAKIGVWSKQQP